MEWGEKGGQILSFFKDNWALIWIFFSLHFCSNLFDLIFLHNGLRNFFLLYFLHSGGGERYGNMQNTLLELSPRYFSSTLVTIVISD